MTAVEELSDGIDPVLELTVTELAEEVLLELLLELEPLLELLELPELPVPTNELSSLPPQAASARESAETTSIETSLCMTHPDLQFLGAGPLPRARAQ